LVFATPFWDYKHIRAEIADARCASSALQAVYESLKHLVLTVPIEKHTRADVDILLQRTAKLMVDIHIANPHERPLIVDFLKLSKRKKLLTLIALTDAENENFVNAVESNLPDQLGSIAWYRLNGVVRNAERTRRLLDSRHLSDALRRCVIDASERGRLVEADAAVLKDPSSRLGCISILQHGSLKQRISMVQRFKPDLLKILLLDSSDKILDRAINWARHVA
jgi:hypothetical protein